MVVDSGCYPASKDGKETRPIDLLLGRKQDRFLKDKIAHIGHNPNHGCVAYNVRKKKKSN